MLIVEWLMRLPGVDGMIVVDKTCTNAMTDDEAVGQASAMWTGLSVRERMPPDGFQIVDQDGRVRSGPCFAASTGYVG